MDVWARYSSDWSKSTTRTIITREYITPRAVDFILSSEEVLILSIESIGYILCVSMSTLIAAHNKKAQWVTSQLLTLPKQIKSVCVWSQQIQLEQVKVATLN